MDEVYKEFVGTQTISKRMIEQNIEMDDGCVYMAATHNGKSYGIYVDVSKALNENSTESDIQLAYDKLKEAACSSLHTLLFLLGRVGDGSEYCGRYKCIGRNSKRKIWNIK